MKIHIETPHYIHEQGKRDVQNDRVFPPSGAATSDDIRFVVGEGPIEGIYLHKATLYFSPSGVQVSWFGQCLVRHIRPGFDVPLFASQFAPSTTFGRDVVHDEEQRVLLTDIEVGDWIVIMTDGMYEAMSDEDLVAILTHPSYTTESVVHHLLEYTSENEDNHSAYLLHVAAVTETEPEATDNVEESLPVEGLSEMIADMSNSSETDTVLSPSDDAEPVVSEESFHTLQPMKTGFELTGRHLLIIFLSLLLLVGLIGFVVGLCY